ncbi:hypothetical protein [Mycolicibacterium diernhoferi]|uniref:Uncharacterized protein n=1 Tax=Mycolicibacterium diernhoferi TaxID=1801 RepID=A0A1Q4HKY5_9MYCO|nr:hypothetical protein [Mycolicibacterium diernhoferi]OJZ68176.1 hypothetical protein BRW64_00850 [Mycolicibacterium diernhoferi]OPE55757.1 hypothetical protein BV510_03430 [Mycolicibacterium diernhoferi]PEG56263.1 hypothetical protein CRI78_02540 [Mycolicibacterium diernhoferi]QYL21336.1 hypothetical protein K0O62_20230 [Mycolicibacterium diernhoferi]
MFSQTDIANNVVSWVNLGVKLPDELAAAIEIFNTVRWVEVGHRPRFDLREVTTENAEEKIREFALEIAVAGDPHQLGPTGLDNAKKHALDAAARGVNSKALSAIPVIIETLTPLFDAHVEAYSEAVSQLPEDLTADRLVASGADTVTAYHEAKHRAAALGRFHDWAISAASVSMIHPANTEKVLTLVRPTNISQLARLDEAAHLLNVDPVFHAIGPVYHSAVKHEIPFAINTPRQASQLRTGLETSGKLVRF